MAKDISHPLAANIIVWGLLAGLMHLLGKSADQVPVNTYTQNHRDFNVFVFWSICRVVFMVFALKLLRQYRLIENEIIQMMITPFAYLIRIAAVIWLLYFFIWKDAIPHILKAIHLNETNWWHDKSEPWLTNCSLINALVCWILWPVFMLYLIMFAVAVPVKFISLIFDMRGRQRMSKFCVDFVCEYFTGYDEYQLKRRHTEFTTFSDHA